MEGQAVEEEVDITSAPEGSVEIEVDETPQESLDEIIEDRELTDDDFVGSNTYDILEGTVSEDSPPAFSITTVEEEAVLSDDPTDHDQSVTLEE